MSEITLTSANFDETVLKADKPVLVDFWAPWCGPCKMFAPTLERFASETDAVIVGKVNVDDEQDLAIRFKVSSIPTLLVFKGGEVAARKVGGMDMAALKEFVK